MARIFTNIYFGFYVSFVWILTIGLLYLSVVERGNVVNTLAFGAIWIAISTAFSYADLASFFRQFYGYRVVWNISRWLARPLLGFRRLPLIGFLSLIAIFGLNVVVNYEVFSPVPRIDLDEVRRTLNREPRFGSETPEVDLLSQQHRPGDVALEALPWPRIADDVSLDSLLLPVQTNLGVREFGSPVVWEALPAQMLRRLSCSPRQDSTEPNCVLQIELPIYVAAGPPLSDRNTSSVFAFALQSHSADYLSVLMMEWRARSEGVSVQASSLPVARTDLAAFLHWRMGTGRTVTDPVLAEAIVTEMTFQAMIAERQNLTIEIAPHPDWQNMGNLRSCGADYVGPPEHCLFVVRCPLQSEGIWNCSRVDERLFDRRSVSVTRNTLDVFPAPQNAPVASVALSDATTRAFLYLFARQAGQPVTIADDEATALRRLATNIRSDYAIILGWPEASDAAHDGVAVTQALARQPHLYAFYRDREIWAPVFDELLEEQLSALGFAEY